MTAPLAKGLAGVPADTTSISFIDGDAGELRYRGYAIADLVARCSFLEVAGRSAGAAVSWQIISAGAPANQGTAGRLEPVIDGLGQMLTECCSRAEEPAPLSPPGRGTG